jgi:hypothetical protein
VAAVGPRDIREPRNDRDHGPHRAACGCSIRAEQRRSDGGEKLDTRRDLQAMNAIDELREQGKMTWIEEEHGWVAAPEDIVDALANEGFLECKRATTTSRRDLRPTGGVWQGVNGSTGSVASTIWVNRASPAQSIVFITIDGESVAHGRTLDLEPNPYTENGGES